MASLRSQKESSIAGVGRVMKRVPTVDFGVVGRLDSKRVCYLY